MVLDRAEPRDLREGVGRELQHVSHDAEIDIQPGERVVGFGTAQRLELEYLEPALFRRRTQRIGFRSRLLRRAENACDLVAALQELVEHALAKILLSDDGYFHCV